MKIDKSLYFLFLAAFFSAALFSTTVLAEELPSAATMQAANAMSDELRDGAVGHRERASGWTESLNEIQMTAGMLVETNAKLSLEYQELNSQIKQIGGRVLAQREKNKDAQIALQQRKADIKAPDSALFSRAGLNELERTVAVKRASLAVQQAKLRGVENKINLRKLRLAELDIQKKAAALDRQFREKNSPTDLWSEVVGLKREIESQNEQTKMIRIKLDAMQKNEQPLVGENRGLAAEVVALRLQIAEAEDRERKLSDRADAVQQKKAAFQEDKTVARYQALVEEKKSALARIAEAEAQIQDAERGRLQDPKLMETMREKMASLGAQSRAITMQIEDLRENIAVLEYKISSLERYQDRNSKKGK